MKQVNNQEFKEIRKTSGMTQKEFATFFKIPYWTVVNWENDKSQCPEYLTELLKFCLTNHYRFDFLHCENCKNNYKCSKIGVEFKCQNRQIML